MFIKEKKIVNNLFFQKIVYVDQKQQKRLVKAQKKKMRLEDVQKGMIVNLLPKKDSNI